MNEIIIPDFALIVLGGVSGAGKSTFAARWFAGTEIVSSDRCRALVSDNQDDQSVTADAFALAREIVERRLKHRRLTVVDATNSSPAERKPWIEIARRHHAARVAIVLDPGLELCIARNAARPERGIPAEVPAQMARALERSRHALPLEGFAQVTVLSSVAEIEAARVVRRPLPVDRRQDTGPFDIVGDVHGCRVELERLLDRLGYVVTMDADGRPHVTHPAGRKLVFTGDLGDRGPDTPGVVRLVMAMAADGIALSVQGNHDEKLARWLAGRKVKMAPGIQASVDQYARETPEARDAARTFLEGLPSHLWLDGGRLAVAHAGLTAGMVGRESPVISAFARFGATDGTRDADGLPVRLDWMSGYDGEAVVVFGHTPMAQPQWIGRTLCIDTGCVFGGALTALRWPERELVSVPAGHTYMIPVRPL